MEQSYYDNDTHEIKIHALIKYAFFSNKWQPYKELEPKNACLTMDWAVWKSCMESFPLEESKPRIILIKLSRSLACKQRKQ